MTKGRTYVFIVHHFDEEGRARANLLAGILNLLNITTVYGENLGGRPVSEEVRRRIEGASLVVVLLTRDIKVGENEWQPTQWIMQEMTWAVAHHVPCLLVVEEGVSFDGGIAGDLEQIHFASGDFAGTLVRVTNQVKLLMSLGVDIPTGLPGANLSDRVRLLILEARECAKKGRWDEVLRLSEEALHLDPGAAEAALNKGVALARLNQLTASDRWFLWMLEEFVDAEDSLLSKVYYNLAVNEGVRDAGGLNVRSLRKQAKYLERSLSLDHKNVYARATLVLCRVALEELSEGVALLMDSLKHGMKFLRALRQVVETKGVVGHRLLSRLPDWLYSILFPTDSADDDAEDKGDDQV